MTIDANALIGAINRTLFAAGNDDLRPVMSGIFFEFYSESVRFVATDAHRLVRMVATMCRQRPMRSSSCPRSH